jgi:hypothetical protein
MPATARQTAARTAALCALAALPAFAPARADAQFGRLRDLGRAAARGVTDQLGDKAGDRAGQAAGEKAGGRAADRAAGAAAGAPRGRHAADEARPRAVKFSDEVVEITDARMAQLVRGLEAEAAARPGAERRYRAALAAAREADRTYPARKAAYEREHAAWARRQAALQACVAKVEAGHAGEVAEQKREGAELETRMRARFTPEKKAEMQALGARLRAAQARGDKAAEAALTDSVMRMMRNDIMPAANEANAFGQRVVAGSHGMMAEARACGTPTAEPQAPQAGGAPDAGMAGAIARQAGRKASGMDERAYDVLRERVEEYVRREGRVGRSLSSYTAGELAVLARNLEALRGNTTLLTGESWAPEQ